MRSATGTGRMHSAAAAYSAAAVGVLYAGISAYWAASGTALLTAVGVAVESGLVRHGAHADLTALRWHAFLWDPWFLLWGLLLMTGLVLSHPHTAPTTAIPPNRSPRP